MPKLVFPMYIWLPVLVIIVCSHYSTIASRLTGNNAVQVLATLILLTYTKIFRVIITVFTSTNIIYPNEHTNLRWLLDGNVEFLHGKHISIFMTCLLLLVVVLIPYTVLLFSIQWLQRISHFKPCFIVNKIKPFLDAYTGPYKDRHRYWTGLLLMARVLMLIIFSTNYSNNPTNDLLAITIIFFLLTAYLAIVGGVYKNGILNVLECFFLLNMGILSAISLYQFTLEESGKPNATYVSVSIALIVFSFIVFFHAIQKICKANQGRKLKCILHSKFDPLRRKKSETVSNLQLINAQSHLTHTSIELEEPLL